MQIVFSYDEAVATIREHWKFPDSADISIGNGETAHTPEVGWTPVPTDWYVNRPPTQTKSTIDVRFNDGASDRGIATDWSASWNQHSTHRIVFYRVHS